MALALRPLLNVPELVRTLFSEETAVAVAILVLFVGTVLGYLVWRMTRSMLEQAGVPAAVEGTVFERSLQNIGFSTVGLVALLAAIFVYALAIFIALQTAQVIDPTQFWTGFSTYLSQLFVAALAIIVGLIVGDKAALAVSERLRGIKLPQVSVLAPLVKYSIFYVAALVALGQLGVATTALLVLLGVYVFGVLFLGGLAFKHLLAAGAAGFYLLLSEPYCIGDEVEIGDRRGVVQEIDVFVTHIENDEAEFIVPNQRVFQSGITRFR
ncbi:Mechanosensitive ion channel protein [Halorhabdus tiamatea SARL4B]|uniref:Mechanosensitive ion channel protein n=1 Tax=Halorhabdus tiamatea SARL4B TaxID=1033806 RepID=F7PN08_9EURY|nr:mechanosensitive ion channel domain-containing protein [Halorhabdus tiamatea]ERJ07714.1 Mechanosensitive ion channel protein [Halorhabdus tiamatea SARL4B]CCQ32628.1 mechanosensitve ion channel protein [Halorhabdus tiamatea SARL4B]